MSQSNQPYTPYWWAAPQHDFAPLDSDLDADVLIVGGGITGVTLAYTLADQGALVGVVDSGPIAGEASGRNAGFLLAAPAEPYAGRIALWGRDGARPVLQLGLRLGEGAVLVVGDGLSEARHRLGIDAALNVGLALSGVLLSAIVALGCGW